MKATLMAAWVGLVLAVTLVSTRATSDKRSDRAMCKEVAIELQVQVDYGQRTQESADEIVNRCFELFVND